MNFKKLFETKNLFIKDLLNDVVIGDQNYAVGQAAAAVKQNNFIRLMTIAASLVFLLVFSLFIIFSHNGSSDALDKVSASSKSFSELNWIGDLLNNFTKAESLRQLIVKVEEGDLNESFFSLGLDRSEGTLESVTKLYLKKTEPFFTQ